MIRDILGGCMDEDCWVLDAPVPKKKNKNKSKVVEETEDEDDSLVEKKNKKKKSKYKVVLECEDEDDSPVEKKKKIKKSKKMKAKVVVVEESEDEDDSLAEKKEKKKDKVKHGKRKIRSDTSEGKENALKAVVDEQSNTEVGRDASMEEDDLSKRITFKEKEPTAVKTKEGAECVEIHDLTKDVIADAGKQKERSDADFVSPPPRGKMMHYAYSSSDDDDDLKAKQINYALDNALGAIANLSDKDDLVVPPP
ncbi:hypothetical protein AALP_AA8G270400 [Arabis alpina]|uniref:Uncharacterized protein n=1 Tax=Arabis alpina TaxID=50452 RepID=A0A087G9Q2_ARAAL|nr:hypothetical protein AALP_AA8G270400 [Arabis alpina]